MGQGWWLPDSPHPSCPSEDMGTVPQSAGGFLPRGRAAFHVWIRELVSVSLRHSGEVLGWSSH